MPVSAVNSDGYEFLLDGTKRLVKYVIANSTVWEIWIPVAQKADLDSRVKD